MKRIRAGLAGIALLVVIVAGSVLPASARGRTVSQAKFSDPLTIDNPYMPLVPGTTFVYDGIQDKKTSHEVFVVTGQTRTVKGILTRVIHDTVYENGKLVEATDDWYAQDDAGNVWYFGEASQEYKNGKVVSTAGSWEAGVNGAHEGIVMEAKPRVGDTYAQEDAPGAQDRATVVSLNESVCVPAGCFTNVLQTREFTALEPGVVEAKYYAPRVGEIKSVMVAGGTEEWTLTSVSK